MKWRASQIGKLMTTSRSKTDVLSQTAKSYIEQLAKEDFFGYTSPLLNRYLDKGINQELESINLLNSIRFENYEKNTLRLENDFITGECDIITTESIIDIKTTWSLETFPALEEDADSYEWQVRGYMYLFNKPKALVVFCMIDTDDDLLSDWDNREIHKVSHIDPVKRITVVEYHREDALDELMEQRLRDASEFYSQYMQQLNNK